MKKITLLLLAALLLLNMTGCKMEQTEVPTFTENQADFTVVAAFAQSYFTQHRKDGRDDISLTLYKNDENGIYELKDITLDNEFADLPDGFSKSLEKVYKSGFTDVKITDGYLIFWDDETCKYGLLYADSPDAAREELSLKRSQIRKIESDWYEIDRGGI